MACCAFLSVYGSAQSQPGNSVSAGYASQCESHPTRTISDLPAKENAQEVRELPPSAILNVMEKRDGGIVVNGTEQNKIVIVACKSAAANDLGRVRQLLSQISLHAAQGEVSVDGPATGGNAAWSVNYLIFVPTGLHLRLQTKNGGIDLRHVTGTIEARTENGGIFLDAVSGDVNLKSTNGGIDLILRGQEWTGKGLDAHSDNGGLTVHVPTDYTSAILAQTASGQLECTASLCARSSRTWNADHKTLRTSNGAIVVKVSTENAPLEILGPKTGR